MPNDCPNCGESLADLTIQSDESIICPKCGKNTDAPTPEVSREQIRTLWAQSMHGVTRPDVTLKPQLDATMPMDEQAASETTSSIASRLNLREQSIINSGEKVEPPPHYELLQQLGEGGMGIVHRARQTSTDRTVALKMIKPQFKGDRRHRSGFLSEAVATANLDHPNIVPVYDVGSRDEGTVFYTMKEVVGTEWKEVLGEKTLAENLEILMRVADAVAFAHSKGIIHRDLKPENVMLGDFGEVLVMDWGLAASVTDDGKADKLDEEHCVGGTPCYMAPEMAMGDAEQIGVASDVYLLGAILFEIITGKRPHTGNLEESLLNAAENVIVETDVTGELMDIAMMAMATEPENRYGTVQDVQAAVREYQTHQESVNVCAVAKRQLEQAKRSGEYDDYGQAIFGFREALKLWEENCEAKEGLSRASFAYAEHALSKGDLDLAMSLLNAEDEAHTKLLPKIETERKVRASRKKRVKALSYASVGLGGLVVVGSIIALTLINEQKNRAVEAERVAVEREGDAVAAKEEAERAHAAAVTSENKLAKTLGEARMFLTVDLSRGYLGPGTIYVSDPYLRKTMGHVESVKKFILTEEKRDALVANGCKYCLEMQGGLSGFFVMIDKPIVRLGRSRKRNNDFFISDMTVGRQHLQFEFDGTSLLMRSAGTGNATRLNGNPLAMSQKWVAIDVVPGDRIEVGEYTECIIRETRKLLTESQEDPYLPRPRLDQDSR